jgi:hypothetical protein
VADTCHTAMGSDNDEIRKSLPVVTGKVNAVIARKDTFTLSELNERTVQARIRHSSQTSL